MNPPEESDLVQRSEEVEMSGVVCTLETREEVDELPLPFTAPVNRLEEINSWRYEAEEGLRLQDIPKLKRLLTIRRLPGLAYDWFDLTGRDDGDDGVRGVARLHRDLESTSPYLQNDDPDFSDEDEDSTSITGRWQIQRGSSLAKLIYSGGLIHIISEAVDLFLRNQAPDAVESTITSVSCFTGCEQPVRTESFNTPKTKAAFRRTWRDLQLCDAERMLTLCSFQGGSSRAILPVDLLRNVKSMLFSWEKDFVRILSRGGLFNCFAKVIARGDAALAATRKISVEVCFELSTMPTRVELVRDSNLFQSITQAVLPGNTAELRTICGGLLTNLTDTEESAMVCLESRGAAAIEGGFVQMLVDLIDDRGILAVQTLTNLSNYSQSRELLTNMRVLEVIHAFEPFSDSAALFRQMCIANLHVDVQFSNCNRYPDTHLLTVPPQQERDIVNVVRVLSAGLQEVQQVRFRLDESVLSIMALLWHPNNRRILSWTNVSRCLVEALLASTANKDRLGFRLALNGMETIFRCIVEEDNEDDQDTRERYQQKIMGVLFFIQRVLLATNPTESEFLFQGLSLNESLTLSEQVTRVLGYTKELERISQQRMDAVD